MMLMRNSTLLPILACGILAFEFVQSGRAMMHDTRIKRTLVIVFAEDLKPVADEWAAYRAGLQGGSWNVVTHKVQPDADLDGQRNGIRQFLRFRFAEHQPGDEVSVLLLGDDDPAKPSAGIPVWRFPQTDPTMIAGKETEYISDHPYQLMDDKDESPDIALGRVPAQNLAEARAVLAKVKRYETPPVSTDAIPAGRNRIVYAAGEGRFGPLDKTLESLFKNLVDQLVPDAFDVSMTYAKATSMYCPPPSKLTDTVLQRISEGSLLFNYLGHGHATGFDSLHWMDQRFPILRVGDIDRLRRVAPAANSSPPQTPIALLTCCSTGHFDLPKGARSMAEALLFHAMSDDPQQAQTNGECDGPIAVIAGSRVTHPYANTVIQMHITKTLLVDRAPTIGMLDLKAEQAMVSRTPSQADRDLDAIAAPIAIAGKWKTNLRDHRNMNARLYNLLGDPATRIALPAQSITDLAIKDNHITGKIEGMVTGAVAITIETRRTSLADESLLQLVHDENDKDLESKAANNYALANDRVLMRMEGKVVDGRFDVVIPNSMPANVGVLRAYANGLDKDGQWMDAIGALRIAAKVSAPAATMPSGAIAPAH